MPSTITDRLAGLTTSVAVKAPCRAATTANITLTGEQTIDGVAVVAGDRVLVKDQTSAIDNGIYVAATSAWTRATDFDGSLDVVGGTWVKANSGTVNGNSYWEVDGNGPMTPSIGSITFSSTSGNLTLQAELAGSGGSDLVGYLYDVDSVAQTQEDVARRERLNLYDKIPKNLWAGIEAGTNTTDLAPYVTLAAATGRGINARAGTFRMALTIDEETIGLDLRGEGRFATYFENVNNSAVLTLDSSTAQIFGVNIEGAYFRNRDPATYTTCDGIKILGAGNGEAFQNDKHVFRDMWLFGFRDGFACYNRAIWLTLEDMLITGSLRDAIHVEVSANVNQWRLQDIVLKGSARNGIFFKHDLTMAGPDAFTSTATGWKLVNASIEDCQYEAVRLLGTGGIQACSIENSTFENNALAVPTTTSPTVNGVVHRKASIHSTMLYFIGVNVEGNTFYNGNGSGNNPDNHLYIDDTGVVVCSGEVGCNRFLATLSGTDVHWPKGLTYQASNVNAGLVEIDRADGSIDMRDQIYPVAFTPQLQFGGANVGMTVTNQVGRSIVIGREVRVQMYFSISAKGSSTGAATITGLPYAALNVANLGAALTIEATGMAGTAVTDLYARVLPGEQVIRLFRYEAGTETALTDADFSATVGLRITGSYLL